MITFLTSSPSGDLDGKYFTGGLDNRNGFTDRLRACWKKDSRCLMITAFPSEFGASEEMTGFFHKAVLDAGLSCSAFDLWDNRSIHTSKEDLLSYDVIFLGGGHVPTQNAFFSRLHLRENIKDFDGIVIGISAGSMNSADLVYAQPELDGEAVDPEYKRWIPGLALTDINILPHYQIVKDSIKDGLRLFADITCKDSSGHKFLALIDGSYVCIRDGKTVVYGDAWKIFPEGLVKICEMNETRQL